MTRLKNITNTPLAGQPADSHRYDDLAQALIATPQVQSALKEVKSYEDLLGKDGLLAGMLKPLFQELLAAEMTEHLGYPKHHAFWLSNRQQP